MIKRTSVLLLVLYTCLSSASAEETRNPFVKITPPPPTPAVMPSYEIPGEMGAVNTAQFNTLELVVRGGTQATVRISSASSGSASEGATKTYLVRDGGLLYIGGKSYSVSLPQNSNSIQVLDKGKVIWEGFLAMPQHTFVTAAPEDSKYAPPPSGGYGVGESVRHGFSSGSNSPIRSTMTSGATTPTTGMPN